MAIRAPDGANNNKRLHCKHHDTFWHRGPPHNNNNTIGGKMPGAQMARSGRWQNLWNLQGERKADWKLWERTISRRLWRTWTENTRPVQHTAPPSEETAWGRGKRYLGQISLPETWFYVKLCARPFLSFQGNLAGSRLLCCQVNRNVRPQVVIFKLTFIKVLKSSKSKRLYLRFGSYTSDAICQCSDTTKMGLCAIFL